MGRAGEKGGKDTGIYKACDWEKLNPGLLALPSSPMPVTPLSVTHSKKQKNRMLIVSMWKTDFISFPHSALTCPHSETPFTRHQQGVPISGARAPAPFGEFSLESWK